MNDGLRKGFLQGTETHAYRFMGCHRELKDGKSGYVFRVWAPNAKGVCLTGDFNGWEPTALPMEHLGDGFYEVFAPDAAEHDAYKFYIETQEGGTLWKADPFGFYAEQQPGTASRVYDPAGYPWTDGAYRRAQARKKLRQNPINIYEVHAGSWRRREDGSVYSYAELAERLVPYVKSMGYTHIELMPLSETDRPWAVTGFYAPSSRYGVPHDLMEFVDVCHASGLGVILGWIPGHFSGAEHGLRHFDGGCCYEAPGEHSRHPRWGTYRFDFGSGAVRSFLISNAVFWLEEYHLDGLRLDDAASILYLDYGCSETYFSATGETVNRDAAEFLQCLNQAVASVRVNVIMAVEERGAFPRVTEAAETGGLDFTLKWCSGWTDDLLRYMAREPVQRRLHHEELTFAMTYFRAEHFMLALSHDEVCSGRPSLIDRIPGYYDDKFANLRTLFGYQMAFPGKKLSFMGSEIAQFAPWNAEAQLDWFLLDYERHRQMQEWIRALNRFYVECRPLWRCDSEPEGFRWLRVDDREHAVVAINRSDRKGKEVIAVFNFSHGLWEHYRLGVPKKGCYLPLLSSDAPEYGGTDVPLYALRSEPIPCDGQAYSAEFTIPPLSVTFYMPE